MSNVKCIYVININNCNYKRIRESCKIDVHNISLSFSRYTFVFLLLSKYFISLLSLQIFSSRDNCDEKYL